MARTGCRRTSGGPRGGTGPPGWRSSSPSVHLLSAAQSHRGCQFEALPLLREEAPHRVVLRALLSPAQQSIRAGHRPEERLLRNGPSFRPGLARPALAAALLIGTIAASLAPATSAAATTCPTT